jgi:predicted ATPase/tetratricopeptide (TPR) repeat protein
VAIELTLLPRVAFQGREITGPRLRGLLALLAGELRTGRGATVLVDALWPDEQPENPPKALQVLVSRVRGQLGSDVIVRTPTGYRLALTEEQVDTSALLLHARAAAEHTREGDHAAALVKAEAGLALWDGAGDSGLNDPLAALRAERTRTHRELVRGRALALSRLGRRAEAVPALTDLAAERPRDEEVLLELLHGEAATLGPAAALARYEAYRRTLRDELGTDPGPALQAAHQELLRDQAPTVRHGVQHEPNPLLGRADDVAAVTTLLHTARVTSIIGPGGLGKTRLAHVVSNQAEQRTVHFVPLAGVSADNDVAAEVAAALDVRESRHTGVLSGIVAALGPGPALLVLDNCEHVIRGAADLAHALVSMTKDLRVLTTSRAPLGLSSESVYPLPELSLPVTAELFRQRARAARPGVELDDATVTELCRHLDGLPLAAELAAARVRVMSVAEIARRLQDRFTLLRGGPRDAPRRHQTLHAVVDWSWNLLDPDGQTAMRALSIFPGGFTAEAAEHMLGRDALSTVEHLVDQSLLKLDETPSGVRFRMLETVREFSTAAREAAGETDRVIDAFLGWARDFGRTHHASPIGPDPRPATELVRAEMDNLVLALRYGLAHDDGPTVMATAAVLAALWTVDSLYLRMAALTTDIAHLISHYRPEPEHVEVTRAAAVLCTAYTFTVHGPQATRSLLALRKLPPAPPDTLIRAMDTVLRAVPEMDLAQLTELCDSAEPLVAGISNGIASYIWERAGDPDNALKSAEQMLAIFEHREYPWTRLLADSRLAELHLYAGRGAEALHHLRSAAQLQEDLGDWSDIVGVRGAMALASLQIGDLDQAEHWLAVSTSPASQESFGNQSFALAARAELHLARGNIDTGLQLWRDAVNLISAERIPGLQTEPGLEPWVLELKSVAVIAHARHGHLDRVADFLHDLTTTLPALLMNPHEIQSAYTTGLPLRGAILLALGMANLHTGHPRTGTTLIALAHRFGYMRQFQPTMSTTQACTDAEQTDPVAYAEAVSAYADLNPDELRAAALAVLDSVQNAPKRALPGASGSGLV